MNGVALALLADGIAVVSFTAGVLLKIMSKARPAQAGSVAKAVA